jgi:uncharacterized protein DUF937
MNILPLVTQFFGPVIVNKIAGSLGINSTVAQRAIAAAAPAILAAIAGKTMQPGGAKSLTETIGKQDPSILSKLGDAIGSPQQAGAVEAGNSALGALFGSTIAGALASALTKYTGIGSNSASSLLGLMTPAILGTLGREQKTSNLDATGLATLLQSQSKQIVDAIPADFSKLLQGTGLLNGLQGGAPATPPVTGTAPTSIASKPANTPASTKPTPASATMAAKPASAKPAGLAPKPTPHHHFSWGPWIVAIAAAAAVWWWAFGDKVTRDQATTEIPATLPPSTTLATNPGLPETLAKTEAGKQIVAALDEARGAVTGVRDAATAQAALAKISDVSNRLDRINGLARELGSEGRRAIASYVASQAGPIKAAITAALGMPGVSGVLKAALDQMAARLDALAKA